ncbi:TetR/AcrR family transcriptional regulator [Pseudomonas sp. UL073]|uniref:TetR/AcrR family transcriptional regulator n=1 Tax=Zestomonas insulae TaxID=2809017 RepID=A0ABS2IG62_9GAMM|nr:TetR/AcrR family transcriptional regulator [Pseudomonas insulae]MBM7060937.1 TetR/AcrR family transcriptional regulator [Pseudomonas insulae]
MATSKREQLVQTAFELFSREGYHATGIDRILAESGVAKMTLYKHFKSKDELIVAVLEQRRLHMLEVMGETLHGLGPREALLAVFDRIHEMISQEHFCGCLFIHAAAEFHDREHSIHREAALQKALTEAHFLRCLEGLQAPQPERLARQLQFLMEGAMAMAHVMGPGNQALEAKAAAEQLLAAAGV